MPALVSLVITTYNREQFLADAIASVQQQTLTDWELLIWDDGSSDGTAAIAQSYAQHDHRIRVIQATHQGRVAALEAAIAHTHGDYLGWIDSDDRLEPTALAETVAVLQTAPHVGMVYTDYVEIDAAGQFLRYGQRCQVPYSPERLLVDFMIFHFRLLRRSLYEQVGGLGNSLDYVEDYDLCLRVSEVTPIHHLPRPLYRYRLHSGNASQVWQVEQHLRAYNVANRALKRRGLSDRYTLEMQLPQGQFILRQKRLPSRAACWWATLPCLGLLAAQPAWSQPIAAPDGTNTTITTNGNQFNIGGGTRSGVNLFHSFSQFGLTPSQIANFLANPQIRNILGRVTGGSPSVIDGRIQVTAGTANLFLMNPAGIVFGSNASLNVPAAFTATTASSIGLGSAWFNATGPNTYGLLTGTPSQFAFGTNQPGAIVNAGNLAVPSGQSLTLFGGTVLSSGTLSAPGGQVTIASIPGQTLLRLNPVGSLLSFDIQPMPAALSGQVSSTIAPPSLAQLLTGGNLGNASRATVNPDGTVQLLGATVPVQAGDVAVRHVTAQTATLSANRNLALVESQLQTTGNLNLLAGHTVIARDSVATPFRAQAGGNLTIQGNQGIDILALNHLQTQPFQSGGNLNLISNGVISSDSHFRSGGNMSVRTLSGQPGNSVSFYDPIVTVGGAYNGGNYTGVALKVQAGGTITFGNITITGFDVAAISDPDSPLLTTSRALILRTSSGDISVGNINTSGGGPVSNGGPVILSAPGNITTGAINTSPGVTGFGPVQGGNVALTAGGSITTGNITSSYAISGFGYGGRGGNVILRSGSTITTGIINTSAISTATFGPRLTLQGGLVQLLSSAASGGNITFTSIDTRGLGNPGNIEEPPDNGIGGGVQILTNGLVRGTGGAGIATLGSVSGPAPVAIRHDGGPTNQPFVIGSPSTNGIAGRINGGPAATIPMPPLGGVASPQTGVDVISVNDRPTITANTFFPSLGPAVTLSFSDLSPVGADLNADVTSIQINNVLAGTLTVNGNPVVGTVTIQPGDTLVYTPPQGAIGVVNAFTIVSNDTLVPSTPLTVQIQAGPPPVPECTVSSCQPGIPQTPPNTTPGRTITLVPDSPDQSFSREYTAYLGVAEVPRPKSLDEQRQIVTQIERETGAKPAFVYISFVPEIVQLGQAKGQCVSSSNEQGRDQLEVLVVTARGGILRKRVPEATCAKVLELAQQFRNEISDPRNIYSDAYLPMAQQLYRWLIAPVESELKAQGINNLVFLMDEGLRSLPVAALHDGNQFLIDRYSMGLMPSLSLTDTRYTDIRDSKVLGLGISESTQGLPPLPTVPLELGTVVEKLWGGKSFLNTNATLATLKAARQQQPFGIIHLATHADFQPGAVSNSYIQLWNGKLHLDQVRQLGWNQPQVELLVLSACATALGNREAELGFAGMAVQTGVKSAVASLWYVNDLATAALIARFYSDLRTYPIKAEALRQAQLALAQGKVALVNGQLQGITPTGIPVAETIADPNQEFIHPYYWAPFTLVGNPW